MMTVCLGGGNEIATMETAICYNLTVGRVMCLRHSYASYACWQRCPDSYDEQLYRAWVRQLPIDTY